MLKKVLIGCGATMALLIALGVGGSVMVVRKFKSGLPDSASSQQVEEALAERDGFVEDYAAPLDPLVDDDKLVLYVRFQERLHERSSEEAEELRNFIGSLDADGGGPIGFVHQGFRLIRGGMGLTFGIAGVEAYGDSLQLDLGISEGDILYYHALTRHGLLGWEVPELEILDSAGEREAKRLGELGQVAEGLEEALDLRTEELFREQRRQLEDLENPSPAQLEWIESLNMALSDDHLSVGLARAFGEGPLAAWSDRELRLRESLPQDSFERFFEIIAIGVDSDDDNGGINIEFNSD